MFLSNILSSVYCFTTLNVETELATFAFTKYVPFDNEDRSTEIEALFVFTSKTAFPVKL
jgi:hypothetical protein